jgi:adenine-specific DNA-methyltransferase
MPSVTQFENRVIPGDCSFELCAMPEASVDLVVTDPPYGANYRDRSGRTVANDGDTAWLAPAFREVGRVLKPGKFCVSFYGWHRADRFLAAWRSAGLAPVGHLVWVKPYASGTGFVAYRHESAYLLAKGRPQRAAGDLIADVLPWDYTGNRLHPTEKPVSAIAPLIEAFSRPGDLVLDPFAGSGTTAVAAKRAGRRYVAVELEARYCAIAEERLRAA